MLIVLLAYSGVVAKLHLNLKVVSAKYNVRETASDSSSHEVMGIQLVWSMHNDNRHFFVCF